MGSGPPSSFVMKVLSVTPQQPPELLSPAPVPLSDPLTPQDGAACAHATIKSFTFNHQPGKTCLRSFIFRCGHVGNVLKFTFNWFNWRHEWKLVVNCELWRSAQTSVLAGARTHARTHAPGPCRPAALQLGNCSWSHEEPGDGPGEQRGRAADLRGLPHLLCDHTHVNDWEADQR